MSGAVLAVTLLAGVATLAASGMIMKAETVEREEQSKDAAFQRDKQPYDFKLTRDGVARLQTLRGEFLMAAIADDRMDSERLSKLPVAAIQELSRSTADVPALLKAAPETRRRALVSRLAETFRSGTNEAASGSVAAWVLMLAPAYSGVELSPPQCAGAARYLMDLHADAQFRDVELCRRAMSWLMKKKASDVGETVSRDDAFLRAFNDHKAVAAVMPYMVDKTPQQLANMAVIKSISFDEADLLLITAEVAPGSSVFTYMKTYYMPRFCQRMTATKTKYEAVAGQPFELSLGNTVDP